MINAEEIKKAQQGWATEQEKEMKDKVHAFISKKIEPEFAKFMTHKNPKVTHICYEPSYDAKMDEAVIRELEEYGYWVKKSHDGGGMKAVYIINWGPNNPKPRC